MKFSELQLHPSLAEGIEKLGFTECTDIQEAAIPHILSGRDLAGLAQTGTGKTAAFLLPLMNRILLSQSSDDVEKLAQDGENESGEHLKTKAFDNWKSPNYILALVPTRELADQVCQNVKELCPSGNIQTVAIFGGTSYDKQIEKIKKGVEIIVATPGRLIDLYKEKHVDLTQVKAVVFDEADRMFDMGFKDDMKYILKRIPTERQFLVFSATLNFDVMNTAYEFGADPVEINISKDQATAENVEDEIFHVGHDEKPSNLLSILKKHKPRQVIIFSNFKKNVERISLFLNKNGFPALGISSLLTQAQRNRVMAQFKSPDEQYILVATDVAARGLDVQGVDMVINYELPDDPENYVHRIGRTGRANEKGHAYSLVSDRDVEALARIEDYTRRKLNMGWLEDEYLVKEFESMPRDSELDFAQGRNGKRKSEGRRGPRTGGDSKRSGGGGRRQHTRGRNNNGDRKRSNSERRDNKEADVQAKSPSESGNSHRDRKTGRHQSKKTRSRRPRTDSRSKKTTTQRKRRSSNNQRRKSSRQAPPPKSFGQKVSGFFKKLFS